MGSSPVTPRRVRKPAVATAICPTSDARSAGRIGCFWSTPWATTSTCALRRLGPVRIPSWKVRPASARPAAFATLARAGSSTKAATWRAAIICCGTTTLPMALSTTTSPDTVSTMVSDTSADRHTTWAPICAISGTLGRLARRALASELATRGGPPGIPVVRSFPGSAPPSDTATASAQAKTVNPARYITSYIQINPQTAGECHQRVAWTAIQKSIKYCLLKSCAWHVDTPHLSDWCRRARR